MGFELKRHHPTLSTLPHLPLATLPTPVEDMEALADAIGIKQLLVKRDDVTGQLYGGNKVRKLAFLLADAIDQQAKSVMTIGAMGSNHVLATCIYARAHDLAPAAQQFEQPVTDHVLNNLRALSTTKPELKLMAHPAQLPFHIFKKKLNDWMNKREQSYYIPGGGSSGVGSIGYVDAIFELKRQIDEGQATKPDVIFVTAGTCGTLAGMALGLKMAKLHIPIYAVRVVDRVVANHIQVFKLVHQIKQVFQRHGLTDCPEVHKEDIHFIHDQLGKDYGYSTAQGLLAMETAKTHGPLKLDATYTGKTFGALMAKIDTYGLKDKTVLYWHTLNSVDLGERIERANIHRDLPEPYLAFFKGQDQ